MVAVSLRRRRSQAALLSAQDAKRKLTAAGPEYFVTVGDDLNFYLGCQKFFFSGWNQ